VTPPHTPYQGWDFSSAQLRLPHKAQVLSEYFLDGLGNKASFFNLLTPPIIWKTLLVLKIMRNKGLYLFLPQQREWGVGRADSPETIQFRIK